MQILELLEKCWYFAGLFRALEGPWKWEIFLEKWVMSLKFSNINCLLRSQQYNIHKIRKRNIQRFQQDRACKLVKAIKNVSFSIFWASCVSRCGHSKLLENVCCSPLNSPWIFLSKLCTSPVIYKLTKIQLWVILEIQILILLVLIFVMTTWSSPPNSKKWHLSPLNFMRLFENHLDNNSLSGYMLRKTLY